MGRHCRRVRGSWPVVGTPPPRGGVTARTVGAGRQRHNPASVVVRTSVSAPAEVLYDELRRHGAANCHLRASQCAARPHAERHRLAHEAWFRMAEQTRTHWKNRSHFLAVASTMMRRILVNHELARSQRSSAAYSWRGSTGLARWSFMPAARQACAVLAEGIGRHRQDRRSAPGRQRTQAARGLQAVHAGHLHVHQHQVEGCRSAAPAPAAVGRHLDLQAHAQQLARDLLVDGLSSTSSTRARAALAQFVLGVGLGGGQAPPVPPPWRSCRAVNQKRLPWPGVLSRPPRRPSSAPGAG
jgi:hypothetical protein